MFKRSAIAALALATSLTAGSASAATLTLDAGWSDFGFVGAGSSWSDSFDFTILTSAFLAITDFQCMGDQFSVSINGSAVGDTSTPTYDGCASVTSDRDFAFASTDYSSNEYALAAGTYTITGTASLSPYGGGLGAIQLSSTSLSPVPVPAAGLLLLGALGGIAGAARKRRKAA